jgi:hypothetical protein
MQAQDVIQMIEFEFGNTEIDKWCTMTLSSKGSDIVQVKTVCKYRLVRRVDSWRMDMAVDTFELIDCQSECTGSFHPKLVALLDSSRGDEEVMQASLEYHPAAETSNSKQYDYRAELKTASPLKVVCNPQVLSNILSIFSSEEPLDAEFANEAATLYGSWKARREREWREALASRQNWWCTLEISAPILVIPADCYRENSPELALDLGLIRFDLDSLQPAEYNMDDVSVAPELATTHFDGAEIDCLTHYSYMTVSSMKVLLSDRHVGNSISWRAGVKNAYEDLTPVHEIMEELKLRFDFHTSMSTTEDKTFVRVKTSDVVLNLSPTSIAQMWPIKTQLLQITNSQVESEQESVHTLKHLERDDTAFGGDQFLEHKWFISSLCKRVVINLEDTKPLLRASFVSLVFQAHNTSSSINCCFRLRDAVVEDRVFEQQYSQPAYLARSCDDDGAAERLALQLEEPDAVQAVRQGNLVCVNYITRSIAGKSQISSQEELHLQLNNLHVEWNPETIATIQTAFLTDSNDSASQPQADSADDPDSSSPAKPVHAEDAGTDAASTWSWKLVATMRQFSVTFNKETLRKKLITLAMRDAKVEYHDFGDKATASGELGNLTFEDMNAIRSEYREILGLKQRGTSLAKFGYEWYSRTSSMGKVKGYDSRTKVDLSPMKLVYTAQLFYELQDYLWAGLFGAIWLETPDAAPAQVQTPEYERHLFLLDAKQPSIIIPQSPAAQEHLCLYAERILLDHDVDIEASPGVPLDHKRVTLVGLGLADDDGVDLTKHCVNMVIDIDTKMVEPGHPALADEARMILLGEIADIDVQLTHEQYLLIMDTMDGNIWAVREDTEAVSERDDATTPAFISYQYDANDDRVWTTMFTYKLNRVALTLKGLDPEEGEDLAVLEIDMLRLISSRADSDFVTTNLLMRSLVVRDHRISCPEFLTCSISPLDFVDIEEDNDVFQIVWTTEPRRDELSGCSTFAYGVDYRVGKIGFYVVPDFVVDLSNFMTRPLQLDAQQHQLIYDCTTTFQASAMEFVLIYDVESVTAESVAIIVSLDVDISHAQVISVSEVSETLSCKMQNVQSFMAELSDPHRQRERVLRPFNTTVTQTVITIRQSRSKERTCHINVNGSKHGDETDDKIDGYLSYEMFQLATNTANAAVKASERLVSTEPCATEEHLVDRFTLHSDPWDIALVDDCDCVKLKLCSVFVDHIRLEVDGIPGQYDIAGDFSIQVDRVPDTTVDANEMHYRKQANSSRHGGADSDHFLIAGFRQALLDPWKFHLRSMKVEGRTDLSLEATNTLRVYLSNVYMKLATSTLSKWSNKTKHYRAQSAHSETVSSSVQAHRSKWSLKIPAPIEITFTDEAVARKPTDIFKLIIDRFDISSEQISTRDTRFDMALGKLEVHDLTQQHQHKFFKMVHSTGQSLETSPASQGEDDLIKLQYNRSQLHAGDWRTDIDVRLNNLHVEWNPETIATIQTAFLTDSNDSASQPQADPADDPDSSSPAKPVHAEDAGTDDASTWSWKLVATMHQFSITMNKETLGRKLITLAMRDAKVEYHDFGDKATASGELGNLTFEDMNAIRSEYREILGLKQRGTSLAKFGYEWYSRTSSMGKVKGYDSRTKVDLSPMKLVYTAQLFYELQDYLWAGLFGAIWLETPDAAPAQVQTPEYERHLFLLDAKQPSIIIPQSPAAQEHLCLYAERILLDHDVDIEASPGVPLDHKRVTLVGLGLADDDGVDLTKHCVNMVIDIDTKMVEPGHPALADEARMILLGEIADIDVQLTHEQYLLIMDTMDGNIWAVREDTEAVSERDDATTPAFISYQYDANDDRVWTTMFTYKLNRVALTLKGLDPEEGEDLAVLEIVRLRLDTGRASDDCIDTDLLFGSVSIIDGRSSMADSLYKCFWRTALTKVDEPAFLWRTHLGNAEGFGIPTKYEVFVRHTEVVGLPDVFYDLSEFFSRPTIVSGSYGEDDSDYFEMLGRVVDGDSELQPASPSLTSYPLSIKFEFSSSLFKQPYDDASPQAPTDPNAPLLDLSLNMTAQYDRKIDDDVGVEEISTVRASEIAIFRHEHVNCNRRTYRVLPSTSINIKERKIQGGSRNVGLLLESVDLRLSFQTTSLIQRLLGAWLRSDSDRDTPSPSVQPSKTTSTSSVRASAIDRGRSAVTNECSVESTSICVTFINDLQQRYMPSLRMSITDAVLKLWGGGQNYQGRVNFVTGAQYYNIKFAEWQQLFILPRIEIRLVSNAKEHSVTVTSVANLSLIVTDSVLSTMSGLLVDPSEESVREEVGLSRIVNLTGSALYFWIGDPDDTPNMVCPGDESRFSVTEILSSDQTGTEGEWEFEEQVDEEWAVGLATWTPYEMTTSAKIEACYKKMHAAGARWRPHLTTIQVKSGLCIDGIEFGFSDGSSKGYGSVFCGGAAIGRPFVLKPGEYLVRVDWRLRDGVGMGGHLAVLQIQFWTSSGRSSRVYGRQEGGRIFSKRAIRGSEISGLAVVNRPPECGGGLQNILQVELRERWSVDLVETYPLRCVDVQMQKEFLVLNPSISRGVKRREVSHADTYHHVEQERMSILVEGPYEPCAGIPINVVGRHFLRMKSTDSSTPYLAVVVIVSCEKGCMVVSCESHLRVRNDTDHELDILMWNGHRLESAGKSVQVNESWPVPVSFAGNSEIRVRPAGKSWSATPLLVTGTYRQTVECQLDGESSSHKLDTELYSDAELVPDRGSRPKNLCAYQLCVYPALILRNFLPVEVRFSVQAIDSSTGDSVWKPERSVDAGENSHIYSIFARHPDGVHLQVGVQTGSEGWRGEVHLIHDRKKPTCADVHLHYHDGRTLRIQAEFTDARTVTLQASCWIQNRTGLCLRFKCEGSRHCYWSDGGTGSSQRDRSAEVCVVPCNDSNSKLQVSVGEGKFSKALDIAQLGAKRTAVSGDETAAECSYTFMVQVDMAPGDLAKTKLVTITPYFAVANNLGHSLLIKQSNGWSNQATSTSPVAVASGGVPTPFHPHPSVEGIEQLVQLATNTSSKGADQQWSDPFDISQPQKNVLILNGATTAFEVRFGSTEACRLLVIGGLSADIMDRLDATPSQGSSRVTRQVKFDVKIPGFEIAFRDMETGAQRQFLYSTTERAVRRHLDGEFLTISVGKLDVRTISTPAKMGLHVAVTSVQIRDKCCDANVSTPVLCS